MMGPDATGPVLVYDGACGFCRRCAAWVRRRLPRHPTVVAWQDCDLAALGLTAARCSAALQWVDAPRAGARRICGGHLAVAALLRHAGGPWRVVGLAMTVPPVSWLARLAYGWVARNRHRFRGLPPGD
jgi:predicted DCC family thiol-disulfide oxidoreductase YuxK